MLVDTHTFLWELMDDPRSSPKAREFLRSETDELVFSLVSLWEVAIKIRTGKLTTIGSSVSYLRDEMNTYGMELLPISYEHIIQVEALPSHHGDPFDRLLIAQAKSESIPILTSDAKIRLYDVSVIW